MKIESDVRRPDRKGQTKLLNSWRSNTIQVLGWVGGVDGRQPTRNTTYYQNESGLLHRKFGIVEASCWRKWRLRLIKEAVVFSKKTKNS